MPPRSPSSQPPVCSTAEQSLDPTPVVKRGWPSNIQVLTVYSVSGNRGFTIASGLSLLVRRKRERQTPRHLQILLQLFASRRGSGYVESSKTGPQFQLRNPFRRAILRFRIAHLISFSERNPSQNPACSSFEHLIHQISGPWKWDYVELEKRGAHVPLWNGRARACVDRR